MSHWLIILLIGFYTRINARSPEAGSRVGSNLAKHRAIFKQITYYFKKWQKHNKTAPKPLLKKES